MRRYRAIHVRVKRLSLRSNEPMISTTARWRSLFSFLARVRLTSFDQPTQSYQDAFEKQYMAYMQQNDRLYDIAVEDNNSSYNRAMWVLVSVLIAVLVVIIAVWFGIKLSLIAPMNRLIESIRHIASGDLVKRIDVEGSNEMGQLAENLRHMQSELMRTVGDVRNGANAIYSGASEIAMGNNDLSSVLSSRQRLWKRPPPVWNN